MSDAAELVRKALVANEAWSPPEPVPFEELTKDTLLPPAAYAAAADLGISREEADAIGRVFFEHMAQLGFGVDVVRADPVGAAAGFSMFWGYLAALRAQRDLELPTELAEALAHCIEYDQPIGKSRRARAAEALESYAVTFGLGNVNRVIRSAMAELGVAP